MDFGDCYRVLGLRSGASFVDIKTSYRRLAQQYHPDINPGDKKAQDKFIALTEAYKLLLTIVPPEEMAQQRSSSVARKSGSVNSYSASRTCSHGDTGETDAKTATKAATKAP